MARLIDADSLLELFDEYIQFNREENSFVNNFCADVCEVLKDTCVKIMPTVDAVEVVHGRWVDEYPYVRCSECYAEWFNCKTDNDPKFFYYCPNCGAKMDLEVKDD